MKGIRNCIMGLIVALVWSSILAGYNFTKPDMMTSDIFFIQISIILVQFAVLYNLITRYCMTKIIILDKHHNVEGVRDEWEI